jgi:prepilin-type N-terminal cleavage/methylation domain-containing protein
MKNKSLQSGFSLVETLVSITILLVIIIGPMSISSSAARSTSFASEQVIAFFLAQEGAEIAQKSRDDILLKYFLDPSDSNYIADPWTEFADEAVSVYERCFEASGCGLELNSDANGTIKTPLSCLGTNCKLYYDASGQRSRYTHTPGANETTPYTRVINFEEVSDNEIRVSSTVYWRTGSIRESQQVSVETYLFNVYGN